LDPIAELKTGPTLHWSKHCFAPTAVFIDLIDERYTKHLPPHETGSWMTLNLVGVNDLDKTVDGEVVIELLDRAGQSAGRRTTRISIPPFGKRHAPVAIQLPDTSGGYLLLAEFTPEIERDPKTTISRRFIKVGSATDYEFYDYQIDPLED